MSSIFVVAYNLPQFAHWTKEKFNDADWILANGVPDSKKFVYVSNADMLRGLSNPHGYLIGSWYERKDAMEIIEALLISSRITNQTLIDTYDALKRYKSR